MFGDKEARQRISEVEKQLSAVFDLGRRVQSLNDDVESLTKRVRGLTTGDVLTVLVRDVIDRIDRNELVKEAAVILKAEIAERSKEDVVAAIRDRDFSEFLDETRAEELLVEALVRHFKEVLSVVELTAKIAEELVQGDHLDLGEIEQGVVNDVTERMEVTVSLSGGEAENGK